MNNKLSIDSIYSKGYWTGRTVREVVDENPKKFDAHIQNYPFLYDYSVLEYVHQAFVRMASIRVSNKMMNREYKRRARW